MEALQRTLYQVYFAWGVLPHMKMSFGEPHEQAAAISLAMRCEYVGLDFKQTLAFVERYLNVSRPKYHPLIHIHPENQHES